MASSSDLARSATRYYQGQVDHRMSIGLADSASIGDYQVIEQRAIPVWRRLQFLEVVREYLGLQGFDLDYLLDLFAISTSTNS